MDNETEALTKELRKSRGPFFGTPIETPGPAPAEAPKKEGRIKPVATKRPPEPEVDKRTYPGDSVKSFLSDAMDKYLK